METRKSAVGEDLVTTSAPNISAEALRDALEAAVPMTVLDIRPHNDRSEWWILELPERTLILPGHVDRPVPFDGRSLAGTLGHVRRDVEALTRWFATADGSEVDDFARWLLSRTPATPPNHHEILRINQGEAASVDLEALEAGANRCAVS